MSPRNKGLTALPSRPRETAAAAAPMRFALFALVLAAPLGVRGQELGSVCLAVSAGHRLIVAADGSVWGFGKQGGGALGIAGAADDYDGRTPVRIPGVENAAAVATAGGQSFALLRDGRVLAWGDNALDALGVDGGGEVMAPREIDWISDAVAIAGWGPLKAVLLADGTLIHWTRASRRSSRKGFANTRQLVVGDKWILALGDDGKLRFLGNNAAGILPGAPPDTVVYPAAVQTLDDIASISASGHMAAAVARDGGVWLWGAENTDERFGSVAAGNHDFTSTAPKRVTGIGPAQAVSVNDRSTLVILKDGTLIGWGSNRFGGLAVARRDVHESPRPVAVAALERVAAVEAGFFSGVAVLHGGNLVTWGLFTVDENYTTTVVPLAIPGGVAPGCLPTGSRVR